MKMHLQPETYSDFYVAKLMTLFGPDNRELRQKTLFYHQNMKIPGHIHLLMH